MMNSHTRLVHLKNYAYNKYIPYTKSKTDQHDDKTSLYWH